MNTTLNQQDNVRALANYLKVTYTSASDLLALGSYICITEEEAYDLAFIEAMSSLWSFSYKFLSLHSNVISMITRDNWISMSTIMNENFNPMVIALLRSDNSLDNVISIALENDGYGAFLNTYDGETVYSDIVCTCDLDDSYVILKMEDCD